jgi:hypothetical protein
MSMRTEALAAGQMVRWVTTTMMTTTLRLTDDDAEA